MLNPIDFVGILDERSNLRHFESRFKVTELEYKAFKAGVNCRASAMIDAINELAKVYDTPEIHRMLEDATTDRLFKTEDLSYEEFKDEWDLYTSRYTGITKCVADYIEGKSGNYRRDEEEAYKEVYKEYVKHGVTRIQEILQYCRDSGYDDCFLYGHPDSIEYNLAIKESIERAQKSTEIPEPPILPPGVIV